MVLVRCQALGSACGGGSSMWAAYSIQCVIMQCVLGASSCASWMLLCSSSCAFLRGWNRHLDTFRIFTPRTSYKVGCHCLLRVTRLTLCNLSPIPARARQGPEPRPLLNPPIPGLKKSATSPVLKSSPQPFGHAPHRSSNSRHKLVKSRLPVNSRSGSAQIRPRNA